MRCSKQAQLVPGLACCSIDDEKRRNLENAIQFPGWQKGSSPASPYQASPDFPFCPG